MIRFNNWKRKKSDIVFSIVTANWNGEKLLDVYLDSLFNQTNQNFILYIVDNGSTDNSIDIINKYKSKINLKLIKLSSNFGFAYANNLGINEAMGDENKYIITLNNDIELEKDCLEQINKKIHEKENKYDVYQILTLNYYNRNIIDAAGISFNKYYGAKQIGYKLPYEAIANIKDNNIDGACAGAAVYSKKCLQTVKINHNEYFDSIYFAYFEDVDLALRLSKAGFNSYLIRDAIVYHIHSGTSGKDSYFKSYYLSRNAQIYRKKNLDVKLFQKSRKIILFNFTKRIVKLALTANFGALHGTFVGYFDYRRLLKSGKIQTK